MSNHVLQIRASKLMLQSDHIQSLQPDADSAPDGLLAGRIQSGGSLGGQRCGHGGTPHSCRQAEGQGIQGQAQP